MGFILQEEQKVWWPVVVSEPADGGKIVRRKFHLLFTLEDPSQWEEENNGEGALVADVLSRVVTDWKDVELEKGEPLSFDVDVFQRLMVSRQHIRLAIWNTYHDEVLLGAKPKN